MKATHTKTEAELSLSEINEHRKLRKLWATGKATRQQILRCMELDAKTVQHKQAR